MNRTVEIVLTGNICLRLKLEKESREWMLGMVLYMGDILLMDVMVEGFFITMS